MLFNPVLVHFYESLQFRPFKVSCQKYDNFLTLNQLIFAKRDTSCIPITFNNPISIKACFSNKKYIVFKNTKEAN